MGWQQCCLRCMATNAELTDLLRPKTYDCKAIRQINTLPDEDAELLRNALADPEVPLYRILEALSRCGVRAAKTTVGDHRRGVCSCRR